jgi:hypothetical protein
MSDIKWFVTMITRILIALVIIISVGMTVDAYEKIETAKLDCRDQKRQLILDQVNGGIE